jgi:hypothetical protein
VKITAFAPHLAGRMLPGIFTYLGVGKVARFPGDPWPHLNSAPAWYWMHATGCSAGLFRSLPVARQPWPVDIEWFEIPATPAPMPAPQSELFAEGTC